MSEDPSPTVRDPFPPASAAPAIEPVRPLAPAPAPRKRSSGMWLNVLLVVAAAVAIGGVSFALGRSTAPATTAAARGGFGTGQFAGNGAGRSFDPNASFPTGAGGFGAGGFGGRGANVGITGTVDSVSADSITIKTANGQTVTLSLDGQTTYHQSTAATSSAVTTGATVTVRVGGLAGAGQGQGGAAASGAPNLTATDITVGQ
jgi:hypothetical protein